MRVRPRSRWGKGLALAAIVLVGTDLFTAFGSLEWRVRPVASFSPNFAAVAGGAIFVAHADELLGNPTVSWAPATKRRWLAGDSWHAASGLVWHRGVFIPLWHLWVPAIVGAGLIERRHARRGRAPLACKACRYDLAGLPLEAVCPECGHSRA